MFHINNRHHVLLPWERATSSFLSRCGWISNDESALDERRQVCRPNGTKSSSGKACGFRSRRSGSRLNLGHFEGAHHQSPSTQVLSDIR